MCNQTSQILHRSIQAATITKETRIAICEFLRYSITVTDVLVSNCPKKFHAFGRLKTQALAVVLLFGSFQVCAQDQVSEHSQLADVLLAWIAAHSSYDTTTVNSPKIIEMTPVEITAEAYTDNPALIPKSRVDDRIFGLYSFEDGPHGTIYVLGAEWTDDGAAPEQEAWMDPIFQERVLHELVHHVQRVSGAYKSFPCRNYGERLAYELGGEFLKQNHAKDTLPNRTFWSRVYSRC